MSILLDTSHYHKVELSHWSNSQDQSFRKCLLQWYWRTVLGLEPVRKSSPLHRGSSVHHALEQFHTLDPKDRSYDILEHHFRTYYETQREAVIATAFDPTAEARDFDDWLLSVGIRTIKGIWERWGKDENVPKLSMTEYTDEVPIPGTDVKYQFRLDALVLNVARPFIFETKTMSKDYTSDYDEHDLQAPRNVWAINQSLVMPTPIEHVVYNFIVFPGKRSKGLLERRVFQPSYKEIQFAIHDLSVVIQEATRDDLAIIHSFSKACAWSCDFYHICKERKFGNPVDNILETEYSTRDNPTGAEYTDDESMSD